MTLVNMIKERPSFTGYSTIIQNIFKEVGCVHYEKKLFPNTLRIIGRLNCFSSCLLGSQQKKLCHREGMPNFRNKSIGEFAAIEDVISIAEMTKPDSIKIIGITNSNIDYVCKIVSNLHNVGFTDISTTCAEFSFIDEIFSKLEKAGLSRATISVHRFSNIEKSLLEMTMNELRNTNLSSIKVNRVLLASQISDLEQMINWIQEKNLTLRLFSLIQTANNKKFFEKESVHWYTQLPIFKNKIERIECEEFMIPNRIRLRMQLFGGGNYRN
ncbi:MAG: hypothetical protein ACOYKD_01690 [Anaerolineaceae bacterium]|jgi:molybdenum cofactor biosynthesis enzyme MoaA